MSSFRPTSAQLRAAVGRTIPDILAPGLNVFFCGINPGLYSAAVGHHFARPGNRFWQALHEAGFTPRRFDPSEEQELLKLRLGLTDIVSRATVAAQELADDELRRGWKRLLKKVHRFDPRFLAILGIGAYQRAICCGRVELGRQSETLGATVVWVLPNPSGLNAHCQLSDVVRQLRAYAEPWNADRPISCTGR